MPPAHPVAWARIIDDKPGWEVENFMDRENRAARMRDNIDRSKWFWRQVVAHVRDPDNRRIAEAWLAKKK